MKKQRELLLKEIDELVSNLDAKNKELADVEKAIKENNESDKKHFQPKEHQKYYYVNVYGQVFDTMFIDGSSMDMKRVKNGNCFRTEEKAEEMAKKVREVSHKIKENNNMDVNKLEQELEELKDILKQKEKQLEKAKEREPFKPKHGQSYYFMDSETSIMSTWYSDDSARDRYRKEIGNCFRTREIAEEAVKKVREVSHNVHMQNKEEKLAIYDCFGCKGFLGEETHITYKDGTKAYVGDVVLVNSKENPNNKNILYVFKTKDYKNGAIMGFACSTCNKQGLYNFYEDYTIEKVIDWSELAKGYIYPRDGAKVKQFEGGNDNE